jgi:hypothetical protein
MECFYSILQLDTAVARGSVAAKTDIVVVVDLKTTTNGCWFYQLSGLSEQSPTQTNAFGKIPEDLVFTFHVNPCSFLTLLAHDNIVGEGKYHCGRKISYELIGLLRSCSRYTLLCYCKVFGKTLWSFDSRELLDVF